MSAKPSPGKRKKKVQNYSSPFSLCALTKRQRADKFHRWSIFIAFYLLNIVFSPRTLVFAAAGAAIVSARMNKNNDDSFAIALPSSLIVIYTICCALERRWLAKCGGVWMELEHSRQSLNCIKLCNFHRVTL